MAMKLRHWTLERVQGATTTRGGQRKWEGESGGYVLAGARGEVSERFIIWKLTTAHLLFFESSVVKGYRAKR